jgi:hypothetical protein
MQENISYDGSQNSQTHKILWIVSAVLILLLAGNLIYFVSTTNNSTNKNTTTSAANVSSISISSVGSSNSKNSIIQVSPSSVKESIPATTTTPALEISFEALDKILGVGEKCTQKQKFVTKITSLTSEGSVSLQFAQSDGYTTGQFDHVFTSASPSFLNEYTWDTSTGTYYMDLKIISPVAKTLRVGFVNECGY